MRRLHIVAIATLVGCSEDPPSKPAPATTVTTSSTSSTSSTSTTSTTATTAPTTAPACGTQTSAVPLSLALARTVPIDGFAWEVRTGRFLDGNGDGVIDAADPQQLWVHTGAGEVLVDGDAPVYTVLSENYRSTATVAELDAGSPGPEVVVAWYEWLADTDRLSWFGGAGELREVVTPQGEAGGGTPWVADLDGDGAPEILNGYAVRDAATGELVADLGVAVDDNASRGAVSADLDLDGRQEIVSHDVAGGVAFYDDGGARIATCLVPAAGPTAFAIGDLDGDPEGEVVVAGRDFVAVCDSDGALLASAVVDLDRPPLVGLGELDGDALPEIVIGDSDVLAVLEHDLTPRFERRCPLPAWWPLSLADLDGDGYHEILVPQRTIDPASGQLVTDLLVLDGVGGVRASLRTAGAGGWLAQPIVADLDADGLAEIALPGFYAVEIFDDGAVGGWDIPEADLPWSGPDRFPGDRGPLGEVPTGAAPHWSTPETNVWQGLPTFRHPAAGGAP